MPRGSGEWHGGKKGRGYLDEDTYKPPRISPHEDVWLVFENALCVAASANSILVALDNDEEVWFPHNQVSDDHSEVYEKGGEGKLVVSEWIVKTRHKEGKMNHEGKPYNV